MEKANRRVASIASHLVPNNTAANNKKEITFDEFKGFVGKELGTTEWFQVKQGIRDILKTNSYIITKNKSTCLPMQL
jgi:hypothetical protein